MERKKCHTLVIYINVNKKKRVYDGTCFYIRVNTLKTGKYPFCETELLKKCREKRERERKQEKKSAHDKKKRKRKHRKVHTHTHGYNKRLKQMVRM